MQHDLDHLLPNEDTPGQTFNNATNNGNLLIHNRNFVGMQVINEDIHIHQNDTMNIVNYHINGRYRRDHHTTHENNLKTQRNTHHNNSIITVRKTNLPAINRLISNSLVSITQIYEITTRQQVIIRRAISRKPDLNLIRDVYNSDSNESAVVNVATLRHANRTKGRYQNELLQLVLEDEDHDMEDHVLLLD